MWRRRLIPPAARSLRAVDKIRSEVMRRAPAQPARRDDLLCLYFLSSLSVLFVSHCITLYHVYISNLSLHNTLYRTVSVIRIKLVIRGELVIHHLDTQVLRDFCGVRITKVSLVYHYVSSGIKRYLRHKLIHSDTARYTVIPQ